MISRTGAVLVGVGMTLPFVGVRINEIEVDTHSATNFSEVASQEAERIQPNFNEAVIKASDPSLSMDGPPIVDTYVTGVPTMDPNYPRMDGTYYSK